jgi:hypothetical protein
MTIYKYELKRTDFQDLYLPEGFKILSCENQNGTICVWALVIPWSTTKTKVTFTIVGTGNPIDVNFPESLVFINSVFDGPFVWHVFYEVLP